MECLDIGEYTLSLLGILLSFPKLKFLKKIYLDKSFLDGEPKLLCVNFAPVTVFQLQDAGFMLLSKHLDFLRVTDGLRKSNQWSH